MAEALNKKFQTLTENPPFLIILRRRSVNPHLELESQAAIT